MLCNQGWSFKQWDRCDRLQHVNILKGYLTPYINNNDDSNDDDSLVMMMVMMMKNVILVVVIMVILV